MKKIMFFGVGDGGCNIVEKIKNKGQIDAKFRGINVSRDYNILYDLMGCRLSRKDDRAVYKIITEEYKLQNASQVVLVTSLGSSATSYLVPNIAKIAKEINVPFISLVTFPFDFEGETINQAANNTLEELKKYCETILVIKNDDFKNKIRKNNFKEVFDEINENVINSIDYKNNEIIFKNLENTVTNEIKPNNKNLIYLLNYNLPELIEIFKDSKFSERNSFRIFLLAALINLWDDKTITNSFSNFYKIRKTKKSIKLFENEIPALIKEINDIINDDNNSCLSYEYLWSHNIYLLLDFLNKIQEKEKAFI